ncbi:MAG: hypothetical protein KF760_03635 [Candidatus Eremiobacteraeota bacterium]|nr:hypothetical protein [Candidatus Eremiobacteraeota bacterium]MCW5871793.1 hypothetical protein [Candidatus Eremiobacteraeota bacterium]
MQIRSTKVRLPGKLPVRKDEPEAPKPPNNLWQTLTSGELLQLGLHLSPAKLAEAINASKDLGKGLGQSWRDIKDTFRKLLHLPVVAEHIDPEAARKISSITMTVVAGVGYAAAGIQGLAGISKLSDGIKEKNRIKQLDGSLDLAMAGAIGTTIAAAGVAPLILVPLAATLGLTRGVVLSVAGYRQGNAQQEVQGALDGTRSVGILGSMLGHVNPLLATAGAICGPVAGVIQSCRGFLDLRAGLVEKSKSKQLQGLTDIGSALGLVLASTGLGTIPGVLLTAASVGARVLYPLSEKFQKRCDRELEKCEPVLEKGVRAVEKAAAPVLHVVRPILDKILGKEDPPPRND